MKVFELTMAMLRAELCGTVSCRQYMELTLDARKLGEGLLLGPVRRERNGV